MTDQNGEHIDEHDSYVLGICARERAESRNTNPFKDTDIEYVYWNRGYDDATPEPTT